MYNKVVKFYERIYFNLLQALWLFIVLPSLAIAEEKIVIASDYRCPYICDNSNNPGYLIELAEQIFISHNIKIIHKIMSWSDALAAAENGSVDAIAGISAIEGRDLLLPTKPQAYGIIGVFGNEELDWTYDEPESLIGKKLALVSDYYLSSPSVQQYITDNYLRDPWGFSLESGENAVVESINSVAEKSSDLYIEYQEIVNDYLHHNNNLSNKIKNCGFVASAPVPLYIAFSGNNPNASKYLNILEEGMEVMQSTGVIKDLKAKYNLQ